MMVLIILFGSITFLIYYSLVGIVVSWDNPYSQYLWLILVMNCLSNILIAILCVISVIYPNVDSLYVLNVQGKIFFLCLDDRFLSIPYFYPLIYRDNILVCDLAYRNNCIVEIQRVTLEGCLMVFVCNLEYYHP